MTVDENFEELHKKASSWNYKSIKSIIENWVIENVFYEGTGWKVLKIVTLLLQVKINLSKTTHRKLDTRNKDRLFKRGLKIQFNWYPIWVKEKIHQSYLIEFLYRNNIFSFFDRNSK